MRAPSSHRRVQWLGHQSMTPKIQSAQQALRTILCPGESGLLDLTSDVRTIFQSGPPAVRSSLVGVASKLLEPRGYLRPKLPSFSEEERRRRSEHVRPPREKRIVKMQALFCHAAGRHDRIPT